MALYVIGDTHLSLGSNKPMDIFGGGWEGYVDKLSAGFATIQPEDTVVLCGDISWAMSLAEGEKDFSFLNALPGRKLILKGNHDYWWTTANKMNGFFQEKGFDTLNILHNNCYTYGDYALCGTRGWFYEEQGSSKVFKRELIRLEASLIEAQKDLEEGVQKREILCFLHYPPLYQGYRCPEIIELLEQYQVKACYYGHLHGGSLRLAMEGTYGNVSYHLVSADHLKFIPKKILES